MAIPPDSTNVKFDNVANVSQFDQVLIVAWRRITWLSTARTADFSGQWTVVNRNGQQLILTRGALVLCIPLADVRPRIKYDLPSLFGYLETLGYVQQEEKSRKTNRSIGSGQERRPEADQRRDGEE